VLDDLVNVTHHQVDKARGILRELMESGDCAAPNVGRLERYLTAEVSGDYAIQPSLAALLHFKIQGVALPA